MSDEFDRLLSGMGYDALAVVWGFRNADFALLDDRSKRELVGFTSRLLSGPSAGLADAGAVLDAVPREDRVRAALGLARSEGAMKLKFGTK